MKKVLFVCEGAFPPTSGTSIVLNNLISEFQSDSVMLAGEKSFGADISKWELPSYPIHIFDHNYTFDVKGSKYLIWTQLNKVVREIINIAKEFGASVIIGIYPSEFYCYAAAKAAKKLGIAFHCWFHNTYKDNRTGILLLAANYIQPFIFRNAGYIFTMSKGMNEYMSRNYGEYRSKFMPLLHGFDVPPVKEKVDIEIGSKVKFLLNGNINHSNSDATERLCKAVLNDQRYELHVYSGTKKETFTAMGITGNNFFHNTFLPKFEDLVAKFEEYDVMLLPHGFYGNLSKAEYETIFPTRTIPLLYSGKPILAHCPSDTNLYKFLSENECASVISQKDRDIIQKAITELVTDEILRATLVRNSMEKAQLFSSRTVARFLNKKLNLYDG